MAAVFTRHQLLLYPDIRPGTRYTLPFFLHHKMGDVLWTDAGGAALNFCEDTWYEAIDHRLIWLDYDGLDHDKREKRKCQPTFLGAQTCGAEGRVEVHFYFGQRSNENEIPADHRISDKVHKNSEQDNLAKMSPEQVLLLADFFQANDETSLDSFLSRWTAYVGQKSKGLLVWTQLDSKASRKHIFIVPLEKLVDRAIAPHSGTLGRSLHLRPSDNCQVLLRRNFLFDPVGQQRLHLRAYFYDKYASEKAASQWIGITSKLGGGAVGLSPNFAGHYSFLRGLVVESPGEGAWQVSSVVRSVGWHLFELELQEGSLLVTVDNEPVANVHKEHGDDCDEVWLGAFDGRSGFWGGVELLHTPLGHGTWEVGVQRIAPGNRRPWRILDGIDEHGIWQVDRTGKIVKVEEETKPAEIEQAAVVTMEEAHSSEDEITEIKQDQPENNDLGEDVKKTDPVEQSQEEIIKPATNSHKVPHKVPRNRPKSRSKSRRKSPSPAPRADLVIDCWSKPNETQIQQLDRIMAALLEKLQEANVTLPNNISRINKCSEFEHADCYIYNFGSRRLHISTREGEGGRITLVVRCGGGFMDFLEFAKRNGAIEQLKLQRIQNDAGIERIVLTSVMSQGAVRLLQSSPNCSACTNIVEVAAEPE